MQSRGKSMYRCLEGARSFQGGSKCSHAVGKAGRIQKALTPVGQHGKSLDSILTSSKKLGEHSPCDRIGVWGRLPKLLPGKRLDGQVLEAGRLIRRLLYLAGTQEGRTGSGWYQLQDQRKRYRRAKQGLWIMDGYGCGG